MGRRLSRNRRRRPSAAVLSGIALLLALTGCSAERSPAGAAEGPAPRPAAGTPTGPVAPPAGAARRNLLYDAEQELQRRCMAAAGFRFWATPENPLPEAREFPYVVDDERWAERYGHGSGFAPRIQRLRRQDPNQVYLRGLTADRRQAAVAALNGPREGEELRAELPGGVVVAHSARGCRAEAWRTLYGDAGEWYAANTLVGNLDGLRRLRVTADPRYATAVRAWSACMRAHGFAYEDPLEARAASLGRKNAPDRALEVRAAVQEARCAHSSGLAAVARRLDRDHDRELRREHRAAVERVERLRAAALPRARAVLGR
ncbi:hypothetical protein ACIRNI_07310 [Streptomyces sp. NPDC093546]|uniref:hypothetical protein n=1 Tax=Streptomyces sp. NPDC093546 TaxID=3366040 RepID=UPI0037FDE089